jgi:hypothetical protein
MNRKCRFAGLVMAGLAFVSTEPALAYMQQYSWVDNHWLIAGNSPYHESYAKVVVPWYSCSASSALDVRNGLSLRWIRLSGIRVYDISVNSHLYNGTTVAAYVQLWRWNGAWVKDGSPQKVEGTISNYGVYNSVVLPDAYMWPQSAGYYMVTADIKWFVYIFPGQQAATGLVFNAASDYTSLSNAVTYPGYIYLY